jgi:hypothetical protein
MRRGGRRPRQVSGENCAVWCPAGRWGPRRTRVSECFSVLRAEELYTALLKDNAQAVAPGARGKATYTPGAREVTASWEIRQNRVWRRGRVFLKCPRCAGRCTRLYLPVRDSWLACRRCWGLTYGSRTLRNYKDSLWGGRFAWMFGTTQREMAFDQANTARQERQRCSIERWAKRRKALKAARVADGRRRN